MRRSLWMRVVTAIWAVWLGAALSTPMAMHPVQMQSAGHMAGQMAGQSAAQLAAMHGMPGMGQAAGADLPADLPADHMPSHGSSNDCSCICNCCCVPPAVAPSYADTGIDSRVVAPHRAVAISIDARDPAALPPHSLPFANGPPAEDTV